MQAQTYTNLYFVPFDLIVRLRWLSLVGQISTVWILDYVGFIMPVRPMAFVLALSFALNLFLYFYKKNKPLLNEKSFPYLLLYDFFQLASLLFFTGGLMNPFVVFILGPLFLMASFNNMKLLCTILISSSLVVSFLYLTPYPLPWFDRGLMFDPLLRFGAAVSLWGSILFYGTYVFYIHHRKAALLEQLDRAEENLAEQKKVTELGLMAAACAHELGTPLGTILLSAQEIEEQTKGSLKEDATLIVSQTKRCQDILQRLSSIYKTSSHFQVDLIHFLTSTFYGYPNSCHFHVENHLEGSYLIEGCPELSLAFGNIFQNAIRHAKQTVTLILKRAPKDVDVCIHNDGPGFDESLLNYLGEILPNDRKYHLGIGLFITKRLLAQKQIRLTFANDKGAMCTIHIPLSTLKYAWNKRG